MEKLNFLHKKRERHALRPPAERIQDYKEHEICPTDAKLINRQASRCMDCGVPFCISACPLGNSIPNFNSLVYKSNLDEAISTLYSTNNFPEFTGRVCPAPCESACVLGLIKDPVNIKQIERFISEKSFQGKSQKPYKPHQHTGKTVAVVGSGPAGLACAQQLNRAGHEVSIIEKSKRAGGLLTYGIPEYKLPQSIINRRLAQLEKEGIRFQFNCEVGKDISLESLKENYDAIALCIGTENPRNLDVEGREGQGIYFAMDFLSLQSAKHSGDTPWKSETINAKGKNVIVIGGGDTGSDCIGTALRQEATSVKNFEILPRPPSRRAYDNPWPQYKKVHRLSTSMEENSFLGEETEYALQTRKFILNSKKQVTAIETVKLKWNLHGKNFSYQEIPNSKSIWPCDLAHLALGYTNPISNKIINKLNITQTEKGLIQTDSRTKMTQEPGVFAAGDCRRGQSLVVWAIAEGRDTASQIDGWLMDKQSFLPTVNTNGYEY